MASSAKTVTLLTPINQLEVNTVTEAISSAAIA
jgi:hypothetical protein